MARKESLTANYMFNAISTVITFLFPLLSTYLLIDRILPDGYGLFAYGYSLTTYFSSLRFLGIPILGLRTLAVEREEKDRLSDNFIKMQMIVFLNTLAVGVIYLLMMFILGSTYRKDTTVYLLFFLYIVVCSFDMTWFFRAIREYKIISIAAACQKAVLLAGILLFVTKPEHLYRYIIIFSVSHFIQFSIFMIYSTRFLNIKRRYFKDIFPYYKNIFKSTIMLYFSILAQSVYMRFDIIILGFFVTNEQIGYYNVLVRIISAINEGLSIITPIMFSYHSEHNKQRTTIAGMNTKKLTFSIMSAISLPAVIGGMVLNRDILRIFIDNPPNNVVIAFAVVLMMPLTVAYTYFTTSQILLPMGKDKFFFILTISAALFNLCANFILIPKLGIIGAAITTVATEILLLVVCLIYYWKDIIVHIKLIYSLNYLVGAGVMGIALVVFKKFVLLTDQLSKAQAFLTIIIGAMIYFVFLVLSRDELVEIGLSKLRSMTKRKVLNSR